MKGPDSEIVTLLLMIAIIVMVLYMLRKERAKNKEQFEKIKENLDYSSPWSQANLVAIVIISSLVYYAMSYVKKPAPVDSSSPAVGTNGASA